MKVGQCEIENSFRALEIRVAPDLQPAVQWILCCADPCFSCHQRCIFAKDIDKTVAGKLMEAVWEHMSPLTIFQGARCRHGAISVTRLPRSRRKDERVEEEEGLLLRWFVR